MTANTSVQILFLDLYKTEDGRGKVIYKRNWRLMMIENEFRGQQSR